MLVLAMFAIVVLSLIGISMASMVQSSEKTIVYEVMGERAEQASLVGVEILVHAIKPVNGNLHICENSFNLDSLLINTQGFEGCTIVVRCTTRSIPVRSNQTEYHYEIKSWYHHDYKWLDQVGKLPGIKILCIFKHANFNFFNKNLLRR